MSLSGSQSSIPNYYAATATPDTPLFGVTTPRDRVVNGVVAVITGLSVVVSLISAFLFPRPPLPLNVYFAACIILLCIGHAVLIYWYRKGDLEPKFRTLIYYNSFVIFCLCICANLYYHDVGHKRS